MRILLILCSIVGYSLFLVGCNSNVENTTSYAAIINYNDQQYIGGASVDSEQYTNIQSVGVIVQRVDAEIDPPAHLTSNAVDKGTEVFETPDHQLLIKQWNGEYQLFSQQDQSTKADS